MTVVRQGISTSTRRGKESLILLFFPHMTAICQGTKEQPNPKRNIHVNIAQIEGFRVPAAIRGQQQVAFFFFLKMFFSLVSSPPFFQLKFFPRCQVALAISPKKMKTL
jgi:hypothetical protein